MLSSVFLFFWCRGPESNRYGCFQPTDFKSVASASSATPAVSNCWLMERVMGIEPTWSAWKAGALPLSYTRIMQSGAGERNWTPNLLITSQLLYQLSYTSLINGASERNRTTDTGIFSPLLYRLSYRGIYKLDNIITHCCVINKWRPEWDLNPWPPPWQGGILTN